MPLGGGKVKSIFWWNSGSHFCVRFPGKIMPDSGSTKWYMIIATSNLFKSEIFAHSCNPSKIVFLSILELVWGGHSKKSDGP